MMTIGNVTGAGNNMQEGFSGSNMQTDSVSINIQKQIADAQRQLQDISSDEDMALEEKMKKRQEIQQEIAALNQQLRQHQIEQRREKQSKDTSMDDMLGGKRSGRTEGPGSGGNGLSKAGMQAMISADSSMKQAQVQGNVATAMKGTAGVLKAEIKQDQGGNTEAKEAELAEVEQKAINASSSQMNTLASANQAVEEAAKAEQDDGKVNDESSKAKSRDKGAEDKDKDEQETAGVPENEADKMSIDIRL